ncbi:MAG TPA: hypothetical protein VGC99_27810 [Candidatus Tectomicrobia bacterium]|jgi:hypothetical protein
MYFQAFRESQKSPLAPDLTYIVEHLVSQLLATADVSALKTALQEARLADMLVDELSFLGQIPRVHLPQVREYLIKQEPTLARSAQRLIREPDNESIRQELCSPHTMTVA